MAWFCQHCNEPSGSIKVEEFFSLVERTFSFSTRTVLHGVGWLVG
jgi:hypothetical protein